MTDKSAVETLRSMDVSQRYSMPWDISPEAYKDLLDRVVDAPTDADGNVLHAGDEVTSWGFDGARRVTSFRLYERGWWEACVEGCEGWTCSDIHKVVTDSRERIEDVRRTIGRGHTYRDQDVLCAIERAYACGRRDGAGDQA